MNHKELSMEEMEIVIGGVDTIGLPLNDGERAQIRSALPNLKHDLGTKGKVIAVLCNSLKLMDRYPAVKAYVEQIWNNV